MGALTVSCESDQEYKKLLKLLAMEKGISIARLVRDALDKVYGEDLTRVGSFFTSSVSNEAQPDYTGNAAKAKDRKSA